MKKNNYSLIIIILFLSTLTSFSQQKLTYKQAYERFGMSVFTPLPTIRGWFDDAHYLELKSTDVQGKKEQRLYKVDAATENSEIFIDYPKLNPQLPPGLTLEGASDKTKDYKSYLLSKDNDLYFAKLLNDSTLTCKRITDDPAEEKNPKFSPDGKFIAYTRNNNIFVYDIEAANEKQLTFDASKNVYNGWASWVYYEEILGRSSNYGAFYWSPNSKSLAYLRFDDTPVPEFPLYKPDGVHGELEIAHYPEAGDPAPIVKLGLVTVGIGKTEWIDSTSIDDSYIAFPAWSPDNKIMLYQKLNHDQDTLKIMKYDLDSMITNTFWRDAQTTWVEFIEDMKIMDDGSGYLITSNRDGWKDLLYYNFDGELLARLTTKDGGIGSVQTIDYKNNTIYFSAFLEKTTESQLYSVKFDGKLLTKLTKAAGNHTCSVSPNGSYFTDSYSSIDSPRKMDLCDGTGKVVRQLGSAESETLKNLKLGKAEIFTIPTDDGYNLPATWVLPPDFDKSKKYPVIIEVYGGPGIKTVYNSFPSMTRFYLAQSGIISMTLDNRGTGHFGKKGENEMYRNLGKCEINDLITAAKYLGKLSFVDTAKIGVTGASYGGYVTCMALTVGSDYFHYGIAEYAPTDWQLYDNIYTERYMDLPSGNKDGYNYANVMNHLDKYKGGLRIVHGTMDDNVHLQNVWQLTSKLQDMNKDFEMMIYIDERHGIHPPKSKHLSRNNLQFWFRKLLGKEFEE